MKRIASAGFDARALALAGCVAALAAGPVRPQDIAYETLMCASLAEGYELSVDRDRNEYRLIGRQHLVDDPVARNEDGTINVVVEIPAGCHDKWEVDHGSGHLTWDLEDGQPRFVEFLPYVGNYGLVPRTLLPHEAGGDGDPLDVLVLGPALPRGAVVRARLLGVLLLTDSGEQDDKLIAVIDGDGPGAPFADVARIRALEDNGVVEIVEAWFTSYKGPGVIVSRGVEGRRSAERILDTAMESYSDH